jgi:hypothetical protein
MLKWATQLITDYRTLRDKPWLPCRVAHRQFEWRVVPTLGCRKLRVSDSILRVRSSDRQFDIAVGISQYDHASVLGPLVVFGPDFPFAQSSRRPLRIQFPGAAALRFKYVHTSIVQTIIQRCLHAKRRIKRCGMVDEYGLPPAVADRIVELASRPVRGEIVGSTAEQSVGHGAADDADSNG